MAVSFLQNSKCTLIVNCCKTTKLYANIHSGIYKKFAYLLDTAAETVIN